MGKWLSIIFFVIFTLACCWLALIVIFELAEVT